MRDPIVSVVLAGGLSSRMGGGDKTLQTLAGKPILKHIIERLRPQTGILAINANGDAARFSAFDLPVIPDTVADYAGPLAGILAGLEWVTTHHPSAIWMLSAAGDTPFIPLNLVERLAAAVKHENTQIAVVRTQGFCHPVIGLWPVSLIPALRHALVEEGLHKVDRFTARYPLSIVDFDHDPIDPFFNINTPEELAQAEAFLQRQR